MDPNHPNTQHFVRVIGERWAEYVKTHSLAECEELNRRVEENRVIRRRLFGQPQAISARAQDEEGGG